jgi:hypothetical protein
LAEIAPYIGEVDLEAALQKLPGPVLTRAEVEALSAQDETGMLRRALWALHRVGLLGHVQHDRVRGEWRQRFMRPGEAELDLDGELPPSTHYLVHPVLSDVVGRINPGFLQRFDRANVIGYDRPWTDDGGPGPGFESELRSCCVLKADVHGFASLMRTGTDGAVRMAMEKAVRQWAPPSAMCEVEAGDSALIADDDPIALAQAARHLVDEVYAAPGQPRLRVALHYGEVQVRRGDGVELINGGSAVLCASRAEPFVEPGQIWATEEFRQQLMERPSLWRTVAVEPPARTASDGESFNVKKPGSEEPDLLVRLYRLEF